MAAANPQGNDDEVGSLIASAIDKVGREGLISLEEGKSTVNELEITEGMGFERGFISGYFVTNQERMEVVLDNAFVLINSNGGTATIPLNLTINGALLGDANNDGLLNILDVIVIVNMVLGEIEGDLSVADLNGDGLINILDITILLSIILNGGA